MLSLVAAAPAWATPAGLGHARQPASVRRAALSMALAYTESTITITEEQVAAYGGPAERPFTDRAPGAGALPASERRPAAPAPALAPPAEDEPYPMELLMAMEGWGVETGQDKPWDPLELASPRWALFDSTPAKLAWYRNAEIKHGRVAMAACVGWVLAASGVTFGGTLTKSGLRFADVAGSDPLETWANVPANGKLQLLGLAFVLESWNEVSKPHYLTEGGRTGAAKVPFGWDPANLMDTFKKTNTYKGKTRTMEELKAASRTSELKNGRLAMIGIASFYTSTVMPGSVPWAGGAMELFK